MPPPSRLPRTGQGEGQDVVLVEQPIRGFERESAFNAWHDAYCLALLFAVPLTLTAGLAALTWARTRRRR